MSSLIKSTHTETSGCGPELLYFAGNMWKHGVSPKNCPHWQGHLGTWSNFFKDFTWKMFQTFQVFFFNFKGRFLWHWTNWLFSTSGSFTLLHFFQHLPKSRSSLFPWNPGFCVLRSFVATFIFYRLKCSESETWKIFIQSFSNPETIYLPVIDLTNRTIGPLCVSICVWV